MSKENMCEVTRNVLWWKEKYFDHDWIYDRDRAEVGAERKCKKCEQKQIYWGKESSPSGVRYEVWRNTN